MALENEFYMSGVCHLCRDEKNEAGH